MPDPCPHAAGQQRQQQPARQAAREADPDVADRVGIGGRAGWDGPLLEREQVGELRPLDVEVLQPRVGARVLRLQKAELRDPRRVGSPGRLGRRHLLQRLGDLVALRLELLLEIGSLRTHLPLDLRYVRQASLWLDLKVLAMTPAALLTSATGGA